jgi:hypothetical protein
MKGNLPPAGSLHDGATGATVVAFGRLLGCSPEERRSALRELESSDPALAVQLARLLAHAEEKTVIVTDFARAAADNEPTPAFQPAANAVVGDFTLIEPLARGGMSEVWRARQRQPERDVAIKIIPTAHRPSARLSALHEPSTLAALRHPAIATIHASGDEPTFTWIAMEFVAEARSITDACRELPLRDRVVLLIEASEAVVHAHAMGFIHRDLKPSNILVNRDGRVKVIDFGIAMPQAEDRLLAPLACCGTPAYLAPEALAADPALTDVRADVRALGVILYELVHGELPAELCSASPLVLLNAIRTLRFDPPPGAHRSTRGDLAAIIARATAIDPDQRYRTVAALVDDLRAFLAHRPIATAPLGVRGLLGRAHLATRRNPVAAVLVCVTFLALVTATAISASYALYARRAALEATLLAAQAGASYHAFVEVCFPERMDAHIAKGLTLEEFTKLRVRELERLAGSLRTQDAIAPIDEVAQTILYACIVLGLPEEAERCAIVRDVIAARIGQTGTITPQIRQLDALYARLAGDPCDPAALQSLETLLPSILQSQRIIRAGALARIGAVDMMRQPLLSERVAEILLETLPQDPETRASAIARLFYSTYRACQRREALTEDHIRLMNVAVDHLEELCHQGDPIARQHASDTASGIAFFLAADLCVEHDPRLIDATVRTAMLASMSDTSPDGVVIGFVANVPLRLMERGRFETATAVLACIDREVSARALLVERGNRIQLDYARAELTARDGTAGDHEHAIEILAATVEADPRDSDRPLAHDVHALALGRLAELAARHGDFPRVAALASQAARLGARAHAAGLATRAASLEDIREHCARLLRASDLEATP